MNAQAPDARSVRGPVLDVILILAVVVALRLPAFGLSVIDWDESIYALVARSILEGLWPFQGVFDHKPAALYELFALAFWIGGDRPAVTHAVGLVAVAVTALGMYHILTRPFGLARRGAVTLTLCYVVAIGGLGGLASNTEVIVNAYAVIWTAAALAGVRRGYVAPVVTGFAMAAAFHTNYLTGVLMVGFAVGFLAYSLMRAEAGLAAALRRYTVFGTLALAAFLAGSALILAPIAIYADVGQYWQEQWAYLTRYAPSSASIGALLSGLEQTAIITLLGVLTVALLGLAMARGEAGRREAAPVVFGLCMLAAGMAAYVATWRFFPHYLIYAVLFGMLTLGSAVAMVRPTRDAAALVLVAVAAVSLHVGAGAVYTYGRVAVNAVLMAHGKPPVRDPARVVAAAASPYFEADQRLYVLLAEPVLYQLLDGTPATRYAFYRHHAVPELTAVTGVDTGEEIDRIFSTPPAMVILGACDPAAGCEVRPEDYASVLEKLRSLGYDRVQTVLSGTRDETTIYVRPGS
ncbi:ArnT family glycosyltransferase [Roseospira marina]|uniref:ArnT family glycosyltransferase n=1 Tax=Roseospira marina TaxID=140057 RepID=UPI0014783967|nr:hypothetical protein [Roseospira marina]MBB4313618.1 hypothetical protein [Roseospira marina]MBB5086780.1 hypothetical protein [Roseospira marina]